MINYIINDFHHKIIYPLLLELCSSDPHPILITQLYPTLLKMLQIINKINLNTINSDEKSLLFISNYITLLARILGKWSTALIICDPYEEVIPFNNIYNGDLIDLYFEIESYEGPVILKDVIHWKEQNFLTYIKPTEEKENKNESNNITIKEFTYLIQFIDSINSNINNNNNLIDILQSKQLLKITSTNLMKKDCYSIVKCIFVVLVHIYGLYKDFIDYVENTIVSSNLEKIFPLLSKCMNYISSTDLNIIKNNCKLICKIQPTYIIDNINIEPELKDRKSITFSELIHGIIDKDHKPDTLLFALQNRKLRSEIVITGFQCLINLLKMFPGSMIQMTILDYYYSAIYYHKLKESRYCIIHQEESRFTVANILQGSNKQLIKLNGYLIDIYNIIYKDIFESSNITESLNIPFYCFYLYSLTNIIQYYPIEIQNKIIKRYEKILLNDVNLILSNNNFKTTYGIDQSNYYRLHYFVYYTFEVYCFYHLCTSEIEDSISSNIISTLFNCINTSSKISIPKSLEFKHLMKMINKHNSIFILYTYKTLKYEQTPIIYPSIDFNDSDGFSISFWLYVENNESVINSNSNSHNNGNTFHILSYGIDINNVILIYLTRSNNKTQLIFRYLEAEISALLSSDKWFHVICTFIKEKKIGRAHV